MTEYRKLPGVKITKNKKNKFTVFELHYSADPDKATEMWKEAQKSKTSLKKWNQEMEIVWDQHAGNPVYPDYNRKFHETQDELLPEIGLPILIGVDFGLTPAAVIGQLQDQKLVIFRELCEFNMGAERFTKKLKEVLSTEYPNWANLSKDYLMFVDPSGFFRKDTDENTCAQILIDGGFNPHPGPVAWEERRTAVEFFLTNVKKGEALLQIQSTNCRMLTKGFQGGYMWPEGAFDIEPAKLRPVKNEYSHIQDALQYLCSGVHNTRAKSKRKSIPSMQYTFSMKKNQFGVPK